MESALVLINVKRGEVHSLAKSLADLDGVSEVFSVAGRYDLVAIVRAKNSERLAQVVTTDLSSFESILNTETLITFRIFSEHDLESMFSIGS